MREWIVNEEDIGCDGAYFSYTEIVRCKDCKHSHPWYADKSICNLWAETGVDVFNDGFCSYGERKDDET